MYTCTSTHRWSTWSCFPEKKGKCRDDDDDNNDNEADQMRQKYLCLRFSQYVMDERTD